MLHPDASASLRRNPAKWAAEQASNIAAARELLATADPALYETPDKQEP